TLALGSCCKPQAEMPANKKELMDAFVAGKLDESYVPGAFFVIRQNKTRGCLQTKVASCCT
ncbi:MAG: hypothetical protein IIW59_00690, partial [Alistipes sp.]|nr:hypothetical protein [Alistipes sp.]